LNSSDLIPLRQAEALVQEMQRQSKHECRAIIDAAERESSALIVQAHASARRRMHDAVEELRREARLRRARAEAQRETATRRRVQRHAAELVRQAWPLLVDAIAARWHDRTARAVWVDSAAREARARLRTKTWTVEHPADWGEDEQRQLAKILAVGDGAQVVSKIDDSLDVGLRIRTEKAVLDATPQGLLADPAAIAGLLLGELQRSAGRCAL
jgi:vacuolar-type H+-ATPase subunit H